MDLRRIFALLGAFLLGALAVVVFFVISEGVRSPTVFDGDLAHSAKRVAVLGAYFLTASWALSRGNPRAVRGRWPLLAALVAPLCGTALLALIVEPHTASALDGLVFALLGVAASFAGAALAARTARS